MIALISPLKRIPAVIWSGFGRFLKIISGRPELGRAGVTLAALLIITLIVVGLFNVWTRMRLVQTGYEIARLEKENKVLKKRKEELRVEIASLQSPQELEWKARQRGLVFPTIDKVIHVP